MYDLFRGDEWLTNPNTEDLNDDEDNWDKHTGDQVRLRAYELLVEYHEKTGLLFDDAASWKPKGLDVGVSADDFQ
jgi:hypothetical protein